MIILGCIFWLNEYLLKRWLFYYYVWFYVHHLCSGTCGSKCLMDLVEPDLLAAMIHHVIRETRHGFSAKGICSLNHWAISLSSKSLFILSTTISNKKHFVCIVWNGLYFTWVILLHIKLKLCRLHIQISYLEIDFCIIREHSHTFQKFSSLLHISTFMAIMSWFNLSTSWLVVKQQ